MSRNKNILFYVLLNIVVSAVTMLIVLWSWNRLQKFNFLSDSTNARTNQDICQQTLIDQSTLPSPEEKIINIKNIFGVGNIDNEVVVVERIGTGSINLSAWQLRDENGNFFTFPDISFTKGEINIYTKPGIDTPQDLYWELPYAVWQTGETVKIIDPNEIERASYIIP